MSTPTNAFSDLEKSKLSIIAGDPVMFEALKKHLLAGIYQNGTLKPNEKAEPTRNFALRFDLDGKSNQELGEDLRAVVEGIRMIEVAFKELSSYKEEASSTPQSSAAKRSR